MSTPIDTNTEELQEILQTVYNLPMAGGGGSAEPDLVIALDNTDWSSMTGHPELLSFNQEDVINTYNKLISGETVNCALNAIYWPHSGGPVKASSPQISVYAKSEDSNSARVGYMCADFNLWYNYFSFTGYLLVQICFDIHGDGTASVESFDVTTSVPMNSAFF